MMIPALFYILKNLSNALCKIGLIKGIMARPGSNTWSKYKIIERETLTSWALVVI